MGLYDFFLPATQRSLVHIGLFPIEIFFGQEDSEKKKYRLVKSSVVYRPKDQGGLEAHDLKFKNRALLGKWLFKLFAEEGVWQTLL
jgi:hypothetical protein